MDTNNQFSNSSYTNQPGGKTDGMPDIRKIIQLVKSNWYLFLITFPLFFGAAYLYHRYTLNIYKGSVTVLLKSEESNRISRTELIEGFGLSPEMKSLENQTIILRSKKIVKRAIDKLDFTIDIYSDGFFKDQDMYHKSPFSIQMDSSHVQLLNTPIHINPLENGKVSVSIQTLNATLHKYNTETNHGGSGEISFEQTIEWGQVISTPFCKFTLNKNNKGYISPAIDFYFYFRSNDWLTSTYRGKVSVTPYNEGSSIIYISSTGSNTTKVINFLNALTEVYLEQSLERKNDIANRTINFIDSQLKQVSDTLQQAQLKLMNFKRNHIFSAPSEITSRLTNQYFELEKELNLLKLKESYYKKLSKHLINDPLSEDYLLPAFSHDANSFILGLITELLTLNNEHYLSKSKTSVNNPYLDELTTKIEVGKMNLLTAIEKLLKNFEIEKDKLNTQLDEVGSKMNLLPEAERRYLDIERDFKLNDAIYTFLLQKQSETQITKASNAPDNEIIDSATIVSIVSPNKQKNNKQALLLALAFPIAIIVLKEYLNNKVRDKSDITSVTSRIPIIGYIPNYKGTHHNVIKEEPLSNLSESFRALRTKLKYMCPEGEKHVITITSTHTGEGKTFCALNIASAFAISGKKTVLVGFDLRKPRLTEIFNHHNHEGLSNYLIGQASFEEIQYSGHIDNLTIIPSGAIPPNPSELMSNNHAHKLFQELQEAYDIIIVDSPPIGIVADSRVLMEHSNCHLYVVRSNKTNKEHFRDTIHNLISEDIKSIGFIFNDISPNLSGYGYYSQRYYSNTKKS
ncbi:polysaccharide biosynthesis tyrosine autokinase [Labilibacter sediminis]|nr:polysaccharide biosynthesis tyrosine autokinase [Labilibacter sediminis]